jgi:hypothetical protein
LAPSAANVMVWLAFATARLFVPLLDAYVASPAKLAPTPEPYVPAPIPDKLAFDSVAIPEMSVDALPTGLPFSVKLIGLPLTPVPPAVSVAESVAVPPYVPDAVATPRDVLVPVLATSAKFCVVVMPAAIVTDAVALVNPAADAVTLYVPGATEPIV